MQFICIEKFLKMSIMKTYEVIDGECIIPCSEKIVRTVPRELRDNITRVVIPDSAVIIGKDAFAGCRCLTDVVLPNSIVLISRSAFASCWDLTKIQLPDSVVDIERYAFFNCSKLEKITLPKAVSKIGFDAFSFCSKLSNIVIPKSVCIIEHNPFRFCDLSNISVEEGNDYYDSRENCNAIIESETNRLIAGCKNSFIPDSVTIIGDDAFYQCTGLTDITIPDSVVEIGYSAFSGCNNLTRINIPKSVSKINLYSLIDCDLTDITVSNDNQVYDSRNNCNAIIETKTNKLIIGCLNTIIPDNVEIIGESAFTGSSLNSIVIPKCVNKICELAFYACKQLTNITITGSNTKFPKDAFKECDSVESILVPAGSVEFYQKQLPKRLHKFVKEF